MAVGVRSWPLSNSLWIFFTMTGAAAGGGGGGGGGGATSIVISCWVGRASVKINGNKTRTPSSRISNTNDRAVVAPRLVLSLPPDSTRLSSNIPVLRRTLLLLRHRHPSICARKTNCSCRFLGPGETICSEDNCSEKREPKYTPQQATRALAGKEAGNSPQVVLTGLGDRPSRHA